MIPFDAPLNPSPADAARWLADELSKWEYVAQRDWLSEFIDWWTNLLRGNPTMPGIPVLTSTFVGLMAIALIGLLAWRMWPGRAESVRRQQRLDSLIEAGVSASDYRKRSIAAMESGDYDLAVIEGFRAIVADLDARGILGDRPARTAREAAALIAGAEPGVASQVNLAAGWFDAAAYGVSAGRRRATREQAEATLRLGDSLRHNATAAPPTPATPSPHDWGRP